MTDLHASTTFLRRALAEPTLLGTPFATGPAMAERIAALVPRSGAPTVVELGPGTGALTVAVRARLPHHSRYLAVELDPGLCRHLAQHLPWLQVVHGDAADLPALLVAAGITEVDLLVASLPWTLIERARRRRMLADAAAALAPGGVFAALTHLTVPPGRARALRADLATAFARVRISAPIWANLPPARLITGRTNASC
jgi:phospholipid N-methyltransferase